MRHCHKCFGHDTSLNDVIEFNIVYQDNKSTIVLEHKGKEAESKRTKHVKVRYFYIKDTIAQREIEMKYCLTERM